MEGLGLPALFGALVGVLLIIREIVRRDLHVTITVGPFTGQQVAEALNTLNERTISMTEPAKQTTRTRMLAIITEIYGLGADSVTNETRLMDIGGFQDFLHFFQRLEIEFGIRVKSPDTLDVLCIGDAIAFVAKKIDDKSTE